MRLALPVVASLLLVGCSASYHTITLHNRSPRAIAALYVYPVGAANHGASRGALARDASLAVKVKSGNVEVLAVGVKERVDDVQSETKTASQVLELRGPVELVFHDSDQNLPELAREGTVGVMFRVIPPPPAPEPAPIEE